MSRSTRQLRIVYACLATLAVAGAMAARPAHATFHLAEISEIMTAYDFDSAVQFVEIRMLNAAVGAPATLD